MQTCKSWIGNQQLPKSKALVLTKYIPAEGEPTSSGVTLLPIVLTCPEYSVYIIQQWNRCKYIANHTLSFTGIIFVEVRLVGDEHVKTYFRTSSW